MADISPRLAKQIRTIYTPLRAFENEIQSKREEIELKIEQDFDEKLVEELANNLRPITRSLQPNLNLLILIVGDSLEPLKLALTIQRPKHLALIHTNRTEETFEKLSSFARNVLKIPPDNNINLHLESNLETPIQVYFEEIRKKWKTTWQPLAGTPTSVAFDVTGGKKTMMVAAFQFATTTQLEQGQLFPMWYMDNDITDTVLGRPRLETSNYILIREPVDISSFTRLQKQHHYDVLLKLANKHRLYLEEIADYLKNPLKRDETNFHLENLRKFEQVLQDELKAALEEQQP